MEVEVEGLQPMMVMASPATNRSEHERSLGRDMRGQAVFQEVYWQDGWGALGVVEEIRKINKPGRNLRQRKRRPPRKAIRGAKNAPRKAAATNAEGRLKPII